MTEKLPSLATPDIQAGLKLAAQLADRLQTQIVQASARLEHPGGMNYRLPLTSQRKSSPASYSMPSLPQTKVGQANNERVEEL